MFLPGEQRPASAKAGGMAAASTDLLTAEGPTARVQSSHFYIHINNLFGEISIISRNKWVVLADFPPAPHLLFHCVGSDWKSVGNGDEDLLPVPKLPECLCQ